jgi:DNA-directed RNA polymerase subunit H (RpoH/RPB5)
MLLAPNSNFASRSGEFKRLLSKINIVEKDTNNVIFVAHSVGDDEPLTKHIEKKLVVYRAEHPNVYVETLPYYMFQIEVPKHVSVPLHVIPPSEEVDKICAKYRTTRKSFPRININETMAVWLGLRLGDVVKVYRISETAGTNIIYRLCE